MTRPTQALGRDALRALLAGRGLRVTEQRMSLLEELSRTVSPISHPELTEQLANVSLDRATVYRNLMTLSEAGLLVRTQLGDGVWRYELPRGQAPTHGQHAHFVCTGCGEIVCLPEGAVSLSGEATLREVAEVQLRGRCNTCVGA